METNNRSSNSTSESVKGNDNNNQKSTSHNVVLNVYDLTPLNNYIYWFGFGIFHSGIEVHGKEYGFGAHDYPSSGVFEVEPRKCPGFRYRCSVKLGEVKNNIHHRSGIRTFIEHMAREYHGDTYHLISKNCNHFTDDLSFRLTSKRIPGWVNRLARIGTLCSCLLPEAIQVTRLKQLPEYHGRSEDDVTESLSTATPRGSSIELDDDQEKSLLSPFSSTDDVSFIKETQQVK